MNATNELIRRLLERYRAQTIAVGGLRAGERFDVDPDVKAVRKLLAESTIEDGSWREPVTESRE